MTYSEWEATLPATVTNDLLWRVQAFRLATFLGACVELDTRSMGRDGRFHQSIGQLCRAAGSVAANIAEGYPRQSARDRVRYYEYAPGSASETKTWYLHGRSALAPEVVEERYVLILSITRLLVRMIRSSRDVPVAGDAFRARSPAEDLSGR